MKLNPVSEHNGLAVIEGAGENLLLRGITGWRILCVFYREMLDRGGLDRDDLARLSALLLAEDVLRNAEDGVRELRADFKALRDHPAVSEAGPLFQPTSPAAEEFVRTIAEYRKRLALDAVLQRTM